MTMILYWILMLVVKITIAVSVSSFKRIPEAELNDVYNSDDMVVVTSVKTKGECAWTCESLGEFRCQSFNVRPEGTKLRCEIFDRIPINGTEMSEDQNAELYERQCEPLYVVASVKEKLKDKQTLVTLIDDKGTVYQVKSSDPTLERIGHYKRVFEGFAGRVDDLFLANMPPYGDIHIIRDEEWLHCFLMAPETHQQFLPCEPKEAFPISFVKLTNDPAYTIPVWMSSDGVDTILSVHPKAVSIVHVDISKVLHSNFEKPDADDSATSYNCSSPLRAYLPLFKQSSSGILISSSEIGVFYEAKYYVYDFSVYKIVRRYSVCRGQDVSYLLGLP